MRATVTVSMLDGSRMESSGEFAPLADRVAFEHQFGRSAVVIQLVAEQFDENGTLRPGADAASIREEWVAFLAWRMLRRGPAAGTSFDVWLEDVEEVELRIGQEENGEVPTETAAALPIS